MNVRLAVAVVAGVGFLVTTAAPAAAHTLSGVQPTNFRSEILTVSPSVAGLQVRLLDLGRRVRLVNRGPVDVIVLGYDREPYLLLGPRGVYRNRHSPAVYINRTPPSGSTATTVPRIADASAPPTWQRVSGGRTATWRDRRTRWEGPPPDAIRRSRRAGPTVVSSWALEVRRGPQLVTVSGRITWVPGPARWPWLALATGLALACVALALRRRWGPSSSIVLAVLVAVDVVHTMGNAMAGARGAGDVAVTLFGRGFSSIVAWVLGAFAIAHLQREHDSGVIAGAVAALIIAVYDGLADVSTLARSQLPSALPGPTVRAAVAVSLGLGVGFLVAVVLVVTRHPELLGQRAPDPEPG